jgi:hypothetical protein
MVGTTATDTITTGAIVTAVLSGITIFWPGRPAWVPFVTAFPLAIALYALTFYADGGELTGRIAARLVLEGIAGALTALGLHGGFRAATERKERKERTDRGAQVYDAPPRAQTRRLDGGTP